MILAFGMLLTLTFVLNIWASPVCVTFQLGELNRCINVINLKVTERADCSHKQ